MNLVTLFIAAVLAAGLGTCSVKAQVLVPGTNLTVTPVNNGTGSIVSIPIPGDSGLSITVGHGSAALPLQNINNMSDSRLVQLGDDWYTNVPLNFQFPYWGQTFNNSWMYSNGVVSFRGNFPNNGCCHGEDLTTLRDTRYNYSIMPLWTDLVDYSGQTTYYRGTADSMTYGWYNTKQYGTNNSNTFEVKINSSGTMDVRYGGIFVAPQNRVTIGMTGDLSKGEYFQYYHGYGFQGPTAGFSWSALDGTGAVDMCIINPLSSPTCPGYQAAYTTQQCTISALFDPSCPGYQAAYTTQQCSIDPLYNRSCPGYATAYHDQQCNLNSLYANDCPGYAAAYLQLQCRANPLYSTTCEGYAAAYHDQQCSISPLFASDCPGYAAAYFNQQCSLNALYDRTCPGYSVAYATKMLLEQQNMASTVATAGVVASTAPTTSSTTTATTSSDGTTKVALVADNNVNNVITSTSTSTAPTAPAAAVQLTAPAPAQSSSPAAPMAQAPAAKQEQKQEDKKAENKPEGGGQSQGGPQGGQQDQKSDQPKTARQEIQERRQEAAKAKAVEQGKDLANSMGKAADMEQQKQIQNVVIQAMGFTPGFDVYKVMMPDVAGYKPYSVYGNQRTVDNRRIGLSLFGATDNLHNDMVQLQYNLGK